MASGDVNVKLSRLFRLAQKFNNFYLSGFNKGDIRPFLVDGQQVGLVKSDVIKQLLKYPEVFCVRDCEYTKVNYNFIWFSVQIDI
ncbi:uncharacterized protein LOC119689007 isoform X3 [Teleopsis dalmanni]|uniref:uncharacterized protein LOC119689007 isoform X3 n=1 Tax=Teleopsis dalmanni TaxID=139649 RepID=UPI0018CFA7C4|nr:uncharacterized protein LOC119689007 isoform X3 [Teleopsis dalmanni]